MRFFPAWLAVLPVLAQSIPAQTSDQKLARDVLKELVEINTTDSSGDNTRAAEAVAARFRTGGFAESDIHVLAPVPHKGNVVVRLRGTGAARPILIIGHLDVVEARRSDWSFDPFVLREQDAHFYGRGTEDCKGNDSTAIVAFLRMKREGFRPSRDLILALTSDEETGPANGVDWLAKQHRELVDAAYCINVDGGGGSIKNGKRVFMSIRAAEKVFQSFKLEASDSGGHSSLPTRNNPIYRVAEGLARLGKFDFPVHLFDVTRANFERSASLYGGQLGEDLKRIVQNPNDAGTVARLSAIPLYNAQLRTTCTATMMSGGHAENALPQQATATVNCRMLPVDKPDEIRRTLEQVVADPKIEITPMNEARLTPYRPLDPQVVAAVTASTSGKWPGIPVIPVMGTGATDAVYTVAAGIPTYGVNGIFIDQDDVRSHGKDERIPVESFYEAVDFMYDLLVRLGK
jgi:acetylornithine deacetylase/succinyl-diaminopimelate desuccinylase-like protein